jgi:hypothetical protein
VQNNTTPAGVDVTPASDFVNLYTNLKKRKAYPLRTVTKKNHYKIFIPRHMPFKFNLISGMLYKRNKRSC